VPLWLARSALRCRSRGSLFHGYNTPTYCLCYPFDEMLGIILFIYALLSHLARETGGLSVVLELGHDGRSETAVDEEGHKR
jgi:hypothetical protein